MNFKKKVSGSWTDTPHYIHNTSTDTITTLPADIYANDTTATVGLKGNMEQSGTPSPSSIIQPSECGERTGNLFDPNSTRYHMGKGTSNRIGPVANGAMFYIKAAPNANYTIKNHTTDSTFVRLYLSNAPIVEGVGESYNVISESETTQNPEVTISNTDYAYLWIQTGGTWYTEHGGSSIMLNTGSSSLPHEPYGYKIPISSAGQTTPVYLGEVESTRRIKKYEFTGQESIVADLPYSRFIFTFNDSLIIGVGKTPAFCTHWQVIDDGRTIANVPNNALYSDSGNSRWFIKTTDYTIANDLKSYLAAQYAAGTPVTVWYVLATPETAVVNEPLMKIGDYADEVSGITIPAIAGGDSVDVETTVKPSEVSLTYTGWHDAEVKEWDGSEWQ